MINRDVFDRLYEEKFGAITKTIKRFKNEFHYKIKGGNLEKYYFKIECYEGLEP